MATFQAGLGRMLNGNLVIYDSVTIENDSSVGAVERAKSWASTVEQHDESWLQVVYNGKAVASLKPGEF
ncbi:hypothetical protein [Bradyrhizobium liaoningense]|uniref:hypothetical protein n=1 Tax=Bradyrhizobium liaoningense TaxID=43992 RepID=UPI001BAC85D9|nr:hypothetical protein [Bradyrhizobium liaoningense]MBR0712198.1 hypothetical protein [Bradyrhizobium liaoningense]